MRFLLIGNYGAGNVGDEALKEYFLERFSDVEWIVTSAHQMGPHDVPRLPFGLRSLLTMPWWKTIKAMRSADAVIFGGGALFTDVESVYACLLWWWHGMVARILRVPVGLAFQGIGPFRTLLGKRCAKFVLRCATSFTVRDEFSRLRAEQLHPLVPVILSFDPVLALLKEERRQGPDEILCVIPRQNSSEALSDAVLSFVRTHHPTEVRILSLQAGSSEEHATCEALKKSIGDSASIRSIATIRDLEKEIAPCSNVITQRYHGALVSSVMGIPTHIIPQANGDKLDAFAALILEPNWLAQCRTRLEEGERELRRFMKMVT